MPYKGMMLSDLPNCAMTFGYTNALWTLKADLTGAWVCRLLRYMDRHGKAIAVPHRAPDVQPEPFLSFTSGYVQRAHDLLPKQGSRRPWQVYQNYLQDFVTIRLGRVDDAGPLLATLKESKRPMNLFLTLILIAVLSVAGLILFTWRIGRRVDAALPPKGRVVAVPGGTLHVREQGQGPALLLIHGLGGQMAHFDYGVAEQLSDQFRVITVDRPGSGHSTRSPGASADLSAQARDLAALIDTLQLGPTIVAGHSLGGAVALTLALEHPRHVRAVALIAPLTHVRDTVLEAFRALTIRARSLRTLFAWTLAIPGTIARSPKVLAQVFGPDPVPRDFATRGGGLLSLRPSQFLAASADLQALAERLPAIQARYPELAVPVAILFGRDDRILDWKANGDAFVNKVPGATLQLVEGGHMLPVTNPGLTVNFIRELAAVATMREQSYQAQGSA